MPYVNIKITREGTTPEKKAGAPDFTGLSCFTSPLALPQENVALLAALARLA